MLGQEHPSVAGGLNDLAWLLKEDQGRLHEAKAMMQQAIDIAKKVFGNEHRNLVFLQGKMGVILLRENPEGAEGSEMLAAALAKLRELGLPETHAWFKTLRE